jgi:hypothetical protein
MTFLSTLLASPPPTALSRFVMWNGVFYALFSGTFLVWPEAGQVLVGAEPFEAGEAGLARALGALGLVIGWFYVMGARTRADSFCLATIVDRLVIVLPVFAILGATGTMDPHIAYLLAGMDTVFALITLAFWWRARPAGV